MAEKNIVRNIKHYRINVGVVIAVLFVLYLLIIIIAYMNQKHIKPYMVESYTASDDTVYTGISLREEQLVQSETAGTVDYFVADGEKASSGATVYTIDETGNFTQMLADRLAEGAETLSSDDWYELKDALYAFSSSYSDKSYRSTYSTKEMLNSIVTDDFYQLAISDLNEAEDTSGFIRYDIDEAAIIQYNEDGFEGKTAADLTADDFDEANYSKTYFMAGKMVAAGENVYKEVTSDTWTLVFPCSEELVQEIGYGTDTLTIYLMDLDLTLTVPFAYATGADGSTLGTLTISKYLTQYLDQRYVEFKIVTGEVSGLLIPKSAVTTESFYLVPTSYFYYNEKNKFGAMFVDVTSGNSTPIFTTFTFYGKKDGYYYINTTAAELGDYFVMTDSQDRYYVSPMETLTGVYNTNQGYTLFRQVSILAELDDMDIVQEDMKYSISKYDYIALDASFLEEFTLTR